MTTRKQIRDAVTTLIEGLPGNAGKVYGYRKLIETSGHAITVQMEEGGLEHYVSDSHTNATLVVRVMTPAVTDIDDALDTIATAIEAAIDADLTLGGLVTRCKLSGWAYERDADDPMTALLLNYIADYS